MRATTNWENKKRSKLHCPSRKHQQKPQTNDIHHVHVPYTSPTVLSTVTTTPTFNSTETKDLKTHAVINNEVNHDVKTHPVFEAELPSLPNTPRSPTKIEVIDLTIDGSENSSAQPPKKKENHHNQRDGDCDNARPCRPCREKNSVYGRPRIWLRFKTCWSIPRCSHPNVFQLAVFVPCCM